MMFSRAITLGNVVALCALFHSATAYSNHMLACTQTTTPPKIDGLGNDAAWINKSELTVADAKANLDHTLTCVHDENRIYIKASYPDTTESRTHKTGIWDEEAGLYSHDTDREDTLVLKWNMLDNQGDISLNSNLAYKADVWYWKAFRTDPTGYADDKIHTYTNESSVKAKKRVSKNGKQFYLVRRGDKGTPAYKPVIHIVRYGDRVNSYSHREPTGSRADIQAKGHWADNVWTIEFARDLDTGEADDVRFSLNRQYQFGVSRYETAGTKPIVGSNNPLHGAGEIGEPILLTFTKELASQ